MLMSAKKIE